MLSSLPPPPLEEEGLLLGENNVSQYPQGLQNVSLEQSFAPTVYFLYTLFYVKVNPIIFKKDE